MQTTPTPSAQALDKGPQPPSIAAGGPKPVCAICQWPIAPGEETTPCPDCHGQYHLACWQDNGGCAVYGCPQVPPTEKREGLEVPVSWWGQENKPCPACGASILAAALRCRNCGATFSSARPQDTAEFAAQTQVKERGASLRRGSIWLFIFCIVPVFSPFGALFGGLWYSANRRALDSLPSAYKALCLIGLTVAIAQTALFVVLGLLFAVFRSA